MVLPEGCVTQARCQGHDVVCDVSGGQRYRHRAEKQLLCCRSLREVGIGIWLALATC